MEGEGGGGGGGVIFQGQLDLKSKAEVAFWCFETLVQLT